MSAGQYLVAVLMFGLMTIGCGSDASKTKVDVDPNEPGEMAIQPLSPEKIQKLASKFKKELRSMLAEGTVNVEFPDSAQIKKGSESEQQLKFKILEAFTKKAVFEQGLKSFGTAFKKVWLKDSIKSRPVFDYYRSEYSNRYDQALNDVMLVVATNNDFDSDGEKRPQDQAGRFSYMRNKIKYPWTLTSNSTEEFEVTIYGANNISRAAFKLLFDSSNIIFINELVYNNADHELEGVIAHELRHYLDMEVDSVVEAEGERNKLQAYADDAFGEREWQYFVKQPGFQKFSDRLSADLSSVLQKLAPAGATVDMDATFAKIVKDIHDHYIKSSRSLFVHYTLTRERSAYAEEFKFLKKKRQLTFKQVLLTLQPDQVYITKNDFTNYMTPKVENGIIKFYYPLSHVVLATFEELYTKAK